jgi:hypothetical protein
MTECRGKMFHDPQADGVRVRQQPPIGQRLATGAELPDRVLIYRAPGVIGRESKNKMSALITSVEHALATAASDTVKVAKFVETSVLPVLKSAQANESMIESVTALISPSAANIERAGFAVLGVVINALDAAGSAASANGLNVTLDAQLVADIKAIAAAVKSALSPAVAAAPAK